MAESQNKSPARGRPKTSALERAQKFLDVDILNGEPSDHVKDMHWIWRGAMSKPTTRRQFNKIKQNLGTTEGYVMPARIRDDDNKLVAVVRVLFRGLRGNEFPYYVKRTHGCDYRCVNPYHIELPDGLNEIEYVPNTDPTDDIEGLVEEIGNFIAANGRDDAAIRSRFLLDYSDEEINTALGRL